MNKKQTIRLNESQLRQIVNETISEMISELDWKTLVNAAKKAEEKGDPRKEIFLKNATDRIKSQYPNRNDYYSDDTHTTEAHINPYLATKYGYLNYNDYVRANDGGAESEYHKSFGDRGVKGRGAYYLDGVRWPWPTRDGKDDRPPYFEGGKEDDWDNMSNDMEDYYTGKSRYEKGKGWVKNEDRLNEAITQAIRTILG